MVNGLNILSVRTIGNELLLEECAPNGESPYIRIDRAMEPLKAVDTADRYSRYRHGLFQFFLKAR